MSLLFGTLTAPDLLRLVAVPVFAWAALRDVRTRRVPNATWLPLLGVGAIALAWDVWLLGDALGFERRLFLIQVALSLGLVAPLGYLFWRLGGFGGADAKAVITLAVVFPVYPTFYLAHGAYPIHQAPLGVFSLTILSNTVLLGLFYPVVLALRNVPRGEVTPAMFIGRPVAVEDVTTEYGRLLETPAGFTRRGLDLDALRMYLRWRGVGFADVRADPDRYRHPLPTERNNPGDGSFATDGGTVDPVGEEADSVGDEADADGEAADAEGEAADADGAEAVGVGRVVGGVSPQPAVRPLDTWGAERFLEEYSAYGTTPEELRVGLETLVEADRDSIWITPGIPFIVPIFAGLVLALTAGDVLYALLASLGWA